MTKTILVLEGTVLPGHRDALLAFLRDAKPFYEAPGGIHMSFMWSAEDDHHFREIFTYDTTRDFDLNQERVAHDPEMKRYLARWRSLLAAPVSVSLWEEESLG